MFQRELWPSGLSATVAAVFWSTALRNGVLAELVEAVWACRVDGASGDEIVLPTGRSQVVLGLDPSAPVAIVHGPMTRPTTIDRSSQRLAAGIVFRAGGLSALTGESTSELVDRKVPLREVVDWDAEEVIETLRAGFDDDATTVAVDRVFERWLAGVERTPSSLIRRSASLLEDGVRVNEVCQRLGVGRSRLVSTFRSEVGVNPKAFSRLKRFERAVGQVRARTSSDLAVVAAGCGYADQAHMSREFTALGAGTPGRLHRDGDPKPTHLAP